jgi:hypothetical protein
MDDIFNSFTNLPDASPHLHSIPKCQFNLLYLTTALLPSVSPTKIPFISQNWIPKLRLKNASITFTKCQQEQPTHWMTLDEFIFINKALISTQVASLQN